MLRVSQALLVVYQVDVLRGLALGPSQVWVAAGAVPDLLGAAKRQDDAVTLWYRVSSARLIVMGQQGQIWGQQA